MVSYSSPIALPFGTGAVRWFTPHDEPMRRDFGITPHSPQGCESPVQQRTLAEWPFCVLTEFSCEPATRNRVLLVAPLSGHFAFILREIVIGLLPAARVSVTDWVNARHVPLSAGDFGFDDNITAIVESIKRLGRGAHVVALCQGVVPALAATAILAANEPDYAPRSLTLLGGPVDPMANPTRVVGLIRQRSLDWFAANTLDRVGPAYPGAGRLVYPASHQLSGLLAYFWRHMMSGGELRNKVFDDDGEDRRHFPFLELFTSLMDLPARYFLENIEKVFQTRQPSESQLEWRGERVDFGAIRDTALMTIEGDQDDIAAPGQTSAAHDVCQCLPDALRGRLVISGAGHFSLFHGRIWREKVFGALQTFIRAQTESREPVAQRLLATG
jgi:poly(3-hydroxybutyrate) depolymerase